MTGVTCVLDMPSVLGVPGREFECLEAICRVRGPRSTEAATTAQGATVDDVA